MTHNPEYGTVLYDLLRKADGGDTAPLATYLAGELTRAASADRKCLLAVRHQYGLFLEGRWHPYSAQPDTWPGTPKRKALVLLWGESGGKRSWHELTIPEGTSIEEIRAEGGSFRMRINAQDVTISGDETFRVIADCSFGLPGFSEVEIARGFEKLTGHAPLDVVGAAEPGSLLGSSLPLFLEDPILGLFEFRPVRPARYAQIGEDRPHYSLLADESGRFEAALAHAREVMPDIEAQVSSSALLVQAIKHDFGKTEAPRLLGATFHHNGVVRISIDDGFESSVLAELELGSDGKLRLIEIEDY